MKKLPVDFLLDSGLLFAINRDVLHPLGLALEMIVEKDGSARIESLWDCRDDPEGILFGAEAYQEGEAKLHRYREEQGTAFCNQRKKLLGFVTQASAEQ